MTENLKTNGNRYTTISEYVTVDRVMFDSIEHWVDIETGEIMQPVKFLSDYDQKFYKPTISYTKATTVTKLKELCKISPLDINSKAKIFYSEKINDLVATGFIKTTAYILFLKLVKHIQYRNLWITDKDTLLKTLSIKNLTRAIQDLQGLVEVTAPNGNKSPVRVLRFNDKLVWKGDQTLNKYTL